MIMFVILSRLRVHVNKSVGFIIYLTVVRIILNLRAVQFNMFSLLKHINISTRNLYFRDQDKSS